MTAIEKAIAEIESQGPGEQFSYRAVAKKFGVAPSTLTRRHHDETRSRAASTAQRRLLTPQQEKILVNHIEKLSKRSIPPAREIIKKYVATLAL